MNHLTRTVRLLAVTAVTLSALSCTAYAGDIKFAVAMDYPSSTVTYNGTASPGAIAHLYRDGRADEHADLVLSNLGGGPVIQYGTGGGRFTTQRTIVDNSDTDASAIEVADFNADGIPDIVSGGYTTPRITVMLGRRDGTFALGGQYPLQGVWVSQFQVADLNRDGHLDIATSAYGGRAITILLGKGDGTFREAPPVPSTNSALALLVADFDGDKIPDIAVTESVPTAGTPGNPSENLLHGEVRILRGNGDATFQPAGVYPIGALSELIRYGDINEDGNKDLVILNALINNEASILYGLGGGKFAPEQKMRIGGPSSVNVLDVRSADGSEGLQLVDLDGDGHLDMAVTHMISSRLVIFQGDGRGNFSPAGSYDTAGFPEDLMAGDLDNDGCLDLAVPGNLVPVGPSDVGVARVSVFLNLSEGCRKSVAAGAGEAPALQCTTRRLALEDVRVQGRRVRLTGVAARSLVGRTVSLRSRGRVVARAKVRADGRFSATATLPARRLRNSARYQATSGSDRSSALKLTRRVSISSMVAKGRNVTIKGRVARPLADPRPAITLTRRVACRYRVVKRFQPRADGTFTASVTAPVGAENAVYRLGTRVRQLANRRTTAPTFSLPLYTRGG